jgi:uncharacterized membrane protein YtjA (UPF0391 family)
MSGRSPWATEGDRLVQRDSSSMLYYALVYFVVALIAAVFGFGGFGAGVADIARILFVLFLVMALVSLFFHLARRH